MRTLKTIVFVMLAGAGLCRAATYYVAPGGNDANSGADWAHAFATISNGVFLANHSAGNVVLVSNGAYVLATNIYITNGITLRGEYGRAITTIDANPEVSNRCVFIDHADAVVEGFTLTGGNMQSNICANGGYGGGAYVANGILRDCIVSSNTGTRGGGVFITNGLISNCVVSCNRAWADWFYVGGGGIYAAGDSPGIYDCHIFGNSATGTMENMGAGGGVDIVSSSNTVMAGCFVSNNTAWNDGGGVICTYALNAVISNCLIADNRIIVGTRYGGGIFLTDSGAKIIDTIISNNYAGGTRILSGGGLYSDDSTSSLHNCTIAMNKAANGGGIHIYGGNMFLTNCIISNNYNGYTGGGHGGGIDDGTYGSKGITAVWCRIVNNSSTVSSTAGGGQGAGIYARSNCVLDHCVIQGNSLVGQSNWGGGISIRSGGSNNVIRNCLIADNVATGSHATLGGVGGGIYIGSNANVNVSACTFAGNYSKIGGGGVYLQDDGADAFSNCVVACNTVANAEATDNDLFLPTSARSNAFWYSCGNLLINTAQGNIAGAPVFANPSESNWRMTNGSPCISAGIVEDWMGNAVDLDGQRRLWRGFGRVDMGAYERPKQGTFVISY